MCFATLRQFKTLYMSSEYICISFQSFKALFETLCIAPPFLTSVLDGSVFSLMPCHFTARVEVPVTNLDARLGAPEPVWKLWSRKKCLAPAGNRAQALQPVDRRCID
jgi:hypothetical protein